MLKSYLVNWKEKEKHYYTLLFKDQHLRIKGNYWAKHLSKERI
jgi:hypothetical protein